MKKIYSILFVALLLCAATGKAQVNLYTFSSSAGTYSEISGGTVLGTTANDEEVFNNNTAGAGGPVTNTGFPIGFNFLYNGVSYDKFAVATNGYIVLGTGSFAIGNTTTTAISSTAAGLANLISGFNQDLEGQAGSELSYLVSGTSPNMRLTVQWKGYKRYLGTAPMNYNYQIILNETTNLVEFSYGTFSTVSSYTAQIGLKGATNADFVNRTTTTDWAATTAGATNISTVSLSATVFPASGLKYTFTPPLPCTTPTSVAASVSGAPTTSSVTGTFTAAPVAPSGYLVVRTSTNAQPVLTNGTTYAVGNNAIGYVEYSGAAAGGWLSAGLTASTTYYYWVFSYNAGCLGVAPAYSASAATTSVTTNSAGTVVSTNTGGLWSSTSTWLSGTVPTASDNVTIADGATVTIDVAAAAYSVTVGQGISGVLDYEATTARTLTVENNVTINTGGTFNTASSGTVTTHSLSVAGSIINNGTMDFAIGTAATGLSFAGPSNGSFTGTGAVTDLYVLTMSKTMRTNLVELDLSNFTVGGLSSGATGALLTSGAGTGTLKISGTNTFSGNLWSVAGYTIPATLGFWLNNPNFTVSGQNGSPTVAGLFRVSQGTYNIGTATGNSMGFSAGSVITVEGGSINAAGRFGVAAAGNVFTYTQTAGTITVGIVGNASTTLASFDLGTSALSTVAISGGNIIVSLAGTGASGPRDYRNQAGTGIAGVTAGTLQVGDANSGAAKTFTINGVVPNLIISNASGAHTVNFGAPVTYNNITLNITVNAGNLLNFGNNVFLFNGNTLVNNGTLTHNGASSRFITFKPATNIIYTGVGVVTAPLTSLELQNDLNFTIDPSAGNIVANRVIIFSGNFVNANKLTLGNGGTTTAIVQIGNTTTPTGGGVFDVAPAFNLGTGGQTISYLRTTNPKTTGPEINPGRILNNLSVDDNVNSLTVAGGPLSVTGTLALTNGVVNNGSANLITVGSSGTTLGTITRTAGMVNGSLKKWYAAATGTATLPIGTATLYKPATINFTTAPTTAGTITATFSATAPNFPNAVPLTEGALIINKASTQGSWFVEAGDGLAGGNYTATFTGNGANDIIDYTRTVLLKRPTAGGDWTLDGTHVTSTGSNTAPVVSRTGMGGFSEFAIGGEAGVVLPITIEYFRGTKQNSRNVLDWKVSCYNSPSVTLILQRSSDGSQFKDISTTTESATRCLQPFNYNDLSPLAGINYYRLKSVDVDRKVSYSNVVALLNKDKGFEIVSLAPNPVQDEAILNVTSAERSVMEIVVSDLNGKQISKQRVSLIAGNNQLSLNLRNVAAGTYQVTGLTADGLSRTLRFVKQ